MRLFMLVVVMVVVVEAVVAATTASTTAPPAKPPTTSAPTSAAAATAAPTSAALATAAPTSAAPATAAPRAQVSLEEAFAQRVLVEAIVECFIDNTTCDPEQEKIRERAVAAMRNMGRCPETLCTPEQQLEMTQAMELLQKRHRDLWIKLLISMFDLDLQL